MADAAVGHTFTNSNTLNRKIKGEDPNNNITNNNRKVNVLFDDDEEEENDDGSGGDGCIDKSIKQWQKCIVLKLLHHKTATSWESKNIVVWKYKRIIIGRRDGSSSTHCYRI